MSLIKMPVKGKAELQFWVRAFQLENEIDHVVTRLREHPRGKTAFAPTIAEYEAGSVLWIFILGICVDPIGICDGAGYIWLTTGQAHKELALRERDKLADQIIDAAMEQDKFDEVIHMDVKKDV